MEILILPKKRVCRFMEVPKQSPSRGHPMEDRPDDAQDNAYPRGVQAVLPADPADARSGPICPLLAGRAADRPADWPTKPEPLHRSHATASNPSAVRPSHEVPLVG